MARCKSSPEVVRTKCELAHRLKAIRVEQYGERGGPELARRLNLPIRTWYNYETGVTVPSEVLLRFIQLTEVDPRWLLNGEGPKFRRGRPAAPDDAKPARPGTVEDLLRRALSLLEGGPDDDAPQVVLPVSLGAGPQVDQVVVRVEEADGEDGDASPPSFEAMPMRRDWLAGSRRFRCLRVRGDAMAPILSDGAVVAIAERPEGAEALDGSLVAARAGGRLLIRWLQVAGRVALLRAEHPAIEPEVVPLADGGGPDADEAPPLRRVLWVSTPHGTPAASPAS